MLTRRFKALLVDDDPIAQRIVGMALGQVNFDCAYAYDGNDALRHLAAEKVDLVVTDLRMPNRNGCELAVELIACENGPVIAVHTSVDDPRVTRELMERGVDDIVYKPANYEAFAAKMEGMVKRRKKESTQIDTAAPASPQAQADANGGCATTDMAVLQDTHSPVREVSRAENERRLANIQHPFPMSPVACEVILLSSIKETTTNKFASTILQDAALTADVLRLANSALYNRNNCPTTDVEEAVVRIGFKKVVEVALALNVLEALRGFIRTAVGCDLGSST